MKCILGSYTLEIKPSKSNQEWKDGKLISSFFDPGKKRTAIFINPHFAFHSCRFVDTQEMQDNLPYRARALFAFEEIDGVDVCFFGMHVQEYGSDCPAPNTRRVYIAYLDSVHFFKPRHFRTSVYHQILLGYLEYMKKLGYTMAHIWACPPSEGDDYIFHCHPPVRKLSKFEFLQFLNAH